MVTITVNGKFFTADQTGGVHRVAGQLTRLLVDRAEAAGHRVRILVPREVELPLGLAESLLDVVPGRAGAGQGWEMVTLPRAAGRRLLVNFCNLAPVAHPNSVVMIHDAQTFICPEAYTTRQIIGYRMMLPLIGRRARRVFTVSEFSRDVLARYRIARPRKVDVVPNGTDHLLAVVPCPDVLARHGLRAGTYVMVLGSVQPYKNVKRVFEALRGASSHVPLVVVGGPARDVYHAIGLEPPPATVFTGAVTDRELRALYEGAAVFAYPSLTEGFGLPPVEAMHCAVPVVASRAGAIPEVCGPAARLVDPADTAGWSRALVELSTGAGAAELVGRGRDRASELTWSATGDRLWDCVRPLVEEGRRR